MDFAAPAARDEADPRRPLIQTNRWAVGPDLRRREKLKTEVFGNFRPPEALAGPQDRQKTTQDEKPVLHGKGRDF